LVGSDGLVRIWNEKGQEVRRFGKPPEPTNKGMGSGFGVAGGGVVVMGSSSWAGGYLSAALSADGKTVAMVGPSGSIQLWDVAGGKATQSIKAGPPVSFAGFLAFAPDGKTLLVQGGDQIVRAYETATGKEVRQMGRKQDGGMGGKARIVPPAMNAGVALSSDGKTLAILGRKQFLNQQDTTLTIFEAATGKEVRHVKVPGSPFMGNLLISPDGKSLVWSSFDGTVRFADLETGVENRQVGQPGKRNFFSCLRFSPDGKTLAAQDGRAVQLWDLNTDKPVRRLGEESPLQGGFTIVSGGSFGSPRTMAFSRDGKKLVAALVGGTLRQWDVASGKEAHPTAGHQGAVLSVLSSADGKIVTTLGADSTLRQWEAATGKELGRLHLPVGSAALADHGRIAAAVEGPGGTIGIWDVAAGKQVRKIEAKPSNRLGLAGTSLTLSPDGRVLAARDFNGGIRVWDTATGKELRQVGETPEGGGIPVLLVGRGGGFGHTPADLAFSPDGRTLAFPVIDAPGGKGGRGVGRGGFGGGGFGGGIGPGADQTIHLWDVRAGRLVRRFEAAPDGVVALAFSPDGKTLASRGSTTVTLWETATGKVRFKFKGLPGVQFGLGNNALSLSPDGRILVVSDQARALRLWDVATGKELGQFKGHQGDIETVAFASDGSKLISGSSDTTALTWDVASPRKSTIRPPVKLTDKELSQRWDDLISDDAALAYEAINALKATPSQAVAMLKRHLKPAAGVDRERIAKLIGELNSDTFKVRQTAMAELEKLAGLAGPALKEALKKNPALETRKRLEGLLEKLSVPVIASELLRSWRALEVLQGAGTAEARQVMAALAKGAPGAPLTVEAQRILDRLTKPTPQP
jgi:WD40 repeat protein